MSPGRKPPPPLEELRKLPPDGRPDYNRLVFEKSPYLLQHASNPIDWFPWSEAAFDKARAENKPVFLSIGYSTCHWCHVMERESFEDDEVAEYMNRRFVSIKVDREEREDIDKIYMSVCVAMTGSGGWPLTLVLTPDKKPFFAGTYFPKSSRYGRPGLMDLLRRITDLWESERPKLMESADRIAEAMSSDDEEAGAAPLGPATIQAAVEHFRSRFDPTHGGFGHAPKFPSPHHYSFLLRTRDPAAPRMVVESLRAMRHGGIFDQVGFGFHRYSTDREWLVPHFEKMLYDQAMLTSAYVETFLATGDEFFARVAREVIEYVRRDLTSPEGGFYSAEDADSEGEEGKFYTWTRREWTSIAGETLSDAMGVQAGGNFEDQATGETPGTNIPHLPRPLEPELSKKWEAARQKLFDVRERRVHPHKDDKILASWNGLMIAAMSKAAAALDDAPIAQAAGRAADFVLSKLRRADGRLLRRYRQGEAAVPAFLDDYAFLVWGLLELYEATFDVGRLEQALDLHAQMTALFWDPAKGGYFFEGHDAEKLFMRRKDLDDGAVPSGNSIAALNLQRLARITGDPELQKRADRLIDAFSADVARMPPAYAQFLIALDFAIGPTQEIVVAGKPDDAGTRALVRAVQSRFLPRKILLLQTGDPRLEAIAPYVKGQGMRDGRAAAYVCENFVCRRPITDPGELFQ